MEKHNIKPKSGVCVCVCVCVCVRACVCVCVCVCVITCQWCRTVAITSGGGASQTVQEGRCAAFIKLRAPGSRRDSPAVDERWPGGGCNPTRRWARHLATSPPRHNATTPSGHHATSPVHLAITSQRHQAITPPHQATSPSQRHVTMLTPSSCTRVCTCVNVCVYMCVYVCVCVYTYLSIYFFKLSFFKQYISDLEIQLN